MGGEIGLQVFKKAICALDANDEDKEKIRATVRAFEDACNYLSKIAFQEKIADPKDLHDLTYRDLRSIFGLPAAIAVKAIKKVAFHYADCPYYLHVFRERSILLEGRLFCLKRKGGLRASISTIGGRVKAKLTAGEYQRRILENQVMKAKIVIKRGDPYVHIYVAQDVSLKEMDDPVGVDLGIKKLLVASNGFKKDGRLINARRRHFASLRKSLESKGTSSARRRLERLKRKERRWMKSVLHQSSKGLVQSLEEGSFVVLERLLGTKIKNHGKKGRRHTSRSQSLSTMGMLSHMITYKCEENGIAVVLVRPDFTSQRCPRCGTIDRYNRRTQALFRCVNCGYQHNADFVASVNLRELALGGWAAVSQPHVIPT